MLKGDAGFAVGIIAHVEARAQHGGLQLSAVNDERPLGVGCHFEVGFTLQLNLSGLVGSEGRRLVGWWCLEAKAAMGDASELIDLGLFVLYGISTHLGTRLACVSPQESHIYI